METTNFVTDTEIAGFLDIAHGNAYNTIVKANEAYFVTPTTLAVTNSLASLPSDCYKVVSVESTINGQLVTLRRFNFQERNRYNTTSVFYTRYQYKYCITGNSLMFKPENSNLSVTLYYVPYPTTITSSSSIDLPIASWYEFMVYSAVADCLSKEQSDTSYALNRMAKALKDIEEQVANRDESEPESVVNVYQQNTIFE
jgi:hypothetical protein